MEESEPGGWWACGGVRCRVHRCGCQLRYYLPTGFRQVIKASQAFVFNAVQCKVLHQHETRLLILRRRTWELGLAPTWWKVFREKRSTLCYCRTQNDTRSNCASRVSIVFVCVCSWYSGIFVQFWIIRPNPGVYITLWSVAEAKQLEIQCGPKFTRQVTYENKCFKLVFIWK